MTTEKKHFDVGTALDKVLEGKTVHCLGTDETVTKTKLEGIVRVDLVIGKSTARMPAQNFLGTYARANFADGPLPAQNNKTASVVK